MGARVVPNSMASWTAPLETEVHHEAAQDHTGHDGHDVARMLSKGREAHNSQDPAHCGPIQVPAGEQDHPIAINPLTPVLISTGAAPNIRR